MSLLSNRKHHPNDIVRFNKSFEINPETHCWEWLGHVGKRDGYCQMRINGKMRGAHKVSYLLYKEDTIPEGLLVCHKCDNRKCVNPDHLFLGTYKDNMQDAVRKGRMSWRGKERPELRRGEAHPSSKLSKKEVLEIRPSSEMGKDLAVKYGVSTNTISRIKSKKIWRHV